MIGNYTLAEDGTAITFAPDIAKKTDYDSFGSEYSLQVRPLAGGETRTLFPTTKGMQIAWAEDGKRYAYGKDGRVYTTSIDSKEPKQVAGLPEVKRGETPDTSKAARDRAAKERFTLVRYSPAGDALLLSNREGLWVLDLASGAKERAIATDDSSATSPRYSLAAWSNDGKQLYFSYAARTKWERGFVRYDRATKEAKESSRTDATTAACACQGRTHGGAFDCRRQPPSRYLRCQRRAGRHAADRREQSATESQADGGHRPRAVPRRRRPQQVRRRLLSRRLSEGQAVPHDFQRLRDFFDDSFDVRTNVLTGTDTSWCSRRWTSTSAIRARPGSRA
jgi:hypothetical protein